MTRGGDLVDLRESTEVAGDVAGPGAVEMVVGPPPDESPADESPASDSPPNAPAPGGRRWLVVGLVAVVLAAAGATWLARTPPRPDVTVVDAVGWYGIDDGRTRAPAAPAGPIAEHWSHALPADHELLGVALVDGTVVSASRGADRPRADEQPEVVVEARAARDGAVRWRRTIAATNPAVLAKGEDESPHLLTRVSNDATTDPSGEFTFDNDRLVVLDTTTGDTLAARNLSPPEAVQVRSDGQLVVHGDDRVSQVDPITGATVRSFDTVTTVVTTGEVTEQWERSAWWFGDGWMVPTPAGWEVTGPDGQVQFTIDAPQAWPEVFGDLVVAPSGSTVTAYRRPTGSIAWQVEVDGEAMGVYTLDEPGDGTQPPSQFVVYLGSSTGLDEEVLIEDGRLVGPISGAERPAWPNPWTRLRVEVDGRTLDLCRELPADFRGGFTPEEPCPSDLALRADGEVVATATTDPGPLTDSVDPATTWRATDLGVLTIERSAVRLRSWEDLSERWSIEVNWDQSWSVPPTILTDANGLLVVTPWTDPPRITWYG